MNSRELARLDDGFIWVLHLRTWNRDDVEAVVSSNRHSAHDSNLTPEIHLHHHDPDEIDRFADALREAAAAIRASHEDDQ